MMRSTYLGRPSKSIQRWLKAHPPTFEGDIYVLDDGTEVRVSANDPLAQGAIHVEFLPEGLDEADIVLYKYGIGHNSIEWLNCNSVRPHGIDLSESKVESFEFISVPYQQLTSFILPNALTSFLTLQLYGNQLSAFSLPVSIDSIGSLALSDNQLTSLILPSTLAEFYILYLDDTTSIDCTLCTSIPIIGKAIYGKYPLMNKWVGSVLVRDEAQKAAFEADAKWGQYKIQIK